MAGDVRVREKNELMGGCAEEREEGVGGSAGGSQE